MRLRSLAALALLLTLAGCGYPGDTRPPSLRVPVPVHDLAAVQRGSKIIVQFTVPQLSTDGIALKDSPYLELYIAGSKFHVKSDKPLAYDEETATPFAGQTVKIGVKAQNDRAQDAGWSNVVDLTVVPALATPTEVEAKAVADGVQVTWKSADRKFVVFREGPGEKTFTRIGDADARTYTDTTAEFGKTYLYKVQTIDPATTPPVESDLSTEKSITPLDTFAPAVPSTVTAVVGTQSVELLWDRNLEGDLAGYRVYRDGKMIGESKDAPSFSDRTVERGKRYSYAISAYDRLNNESAKSEPVEVQIP
jgi:fibronectin type 3 domain-containing protein